MEIFLIIFISFVLAFIVLKLNNYLLNKTKLQKLIVLLPITLLLIVYFIILNNHMPVGSFFGNLNPNVVFLLIGIIILIMLVFNFINKKLKNKNVKFILSILISLIILYLCGYITFFNVMQLKNLVPANWVIGVDEMRLYL